MRAAAGEPADRGLRGRRGARTRHEVRRRPLPRLAATRSTPCWPAGATATPSCSGTATATSSGVDAVVVPGGFSYGDYLRAGAIARFSPVMEAVAEFARDGGPVLGICNGFQVLCEAGLLPGALLPNTSLRFVCRQVDVEVENAGTRPSRARARDGRAALDPGQAHHRPLLRAARDARRAGGRRPGGAALRAGAEPERLGARHRRRAQRGGQRDRADAPPRARRGPAHRLGRRRHAVRVARGARGRAGRRRARSTSARAPRARPHRRRVRADRRALGREPNGARAGRVLADVVRALRLQALEEAAAPAAHRGPARADGAGRERRRGRRRRRPGGRLQGRVAQPPERGRAVPGRGHRRRRDPARRVRDRRAADRDARLAALRRARLARARATCSTASVAGIGHYGNSIGVPTVGGEVYFEAPLRAELPRQRDVRGPRARATG